jgi:hypothetical protein
VLPQQLDEVPYSIFILLAAVDLSHPTDNLSNIMRYVTHTSEMAITSSYIVFMAAILTASLAVNPDLSIAFQTWPSLHCGDSS